MQLRNLVLVDAARSPFARGLAAQCIGAGMGISTVIERAD
jgi:acetyl-CoA acetyltransferase